MQTKISQLQAFILAGGQSRRMGTDKSQLRLENQTFTERVAETLEKVSAAVTLVGARHTHPKYKSVADVYPGWGALGGLHAALAACDSEWAIVVACDLPFVTAGLFNYLALLRENCDAVVPVQQDGRPQPLAALYRIEPCRQRAAELIGSGRRRPLDLLELVNTRWVPFNELRNLDQAEKFFVNINTPDDYDALAMRDSR
ncbi:MAG TPA: molybdenum cofactor guanylyltransferase [Candidatus Limnocylindria bacterium]|nr:molybdenum cofactor guanylyltransferase [Candidatus Limnocylindria bacterium]